MCNPGLLIAASAATAAIGTGYAALQGAAMGRYQSAVSRQNAKLEAEAAHDAQTRTKLEAGRTYRKGAQVAGAQVAQMAANGVDLSWGSPVQVQQDTAAGIADDVAQVYAQGEQDARGHDIAGSNATAQARAAKANANASIVSGVFGVTSSILGGATQYSKYRANPDAWGGG